MNSLNAAVARIMWHMNANNTTALTLPFDDPRSPENIARRRALKIAERDPQGRLYPGSRIPGAGRKPDGVTVTALARVHTAQAIQVLREVMDDPKAPQAARVAASQALLDRAWGKSPVTIDLNVKAKFDSFLADVGVTVEYEKAALLNVIDAVIADVNDENLPQEQLGIDQIEH